MEEKSCAGAMSSNEKNSSTSVEVNFMGFSIDEERICKFTIFSDNFVLVL